jgi:hypothetical protein
MSTDKGGPQTMSTSVNIARLRRASFAVVDC